MDLFNDFRDRNAYRGVPEPTAVLLGVFPYKNYYFFFLLKGLEVVSGSWFVLRREISL